MTKSVADLEEAKIAQTPAPEPQPTSSIVDQNLRDAVIRVFHQYGNDLGAFRRDIQKELEKRIG